MLRAVSPVPSFSIQLRDFFVDPVHRAAVELRQVASRRPFRGVAQAFADMRHRDAHAPGLGRPRMPGHVEGQPAAAHAPRASNERGFLDTQMTRVDNLPL